MPRQPLGGFRRAAEGVSGRAASPAPAAATADARPDRGRGRAPACRRRSRPLSTSAGIGAELASATRRVSEVNSIAFRKAISFAPSGSSMTDSSSGTSSGVFWSSVTSVARQARLVGEVDQVLAALGLLDLAGALQQRFEIAVFVEQLRGGLRPDARHARHVVDGVAAQRLQVDHLLRADAEFLDHLVGAEAACPSSCRSRMTRGPTSCIRSLSEETMVTSPPASRAMAGIGGDEVVGLEALLLDAGQVEGARRLADQRELRDEVFRRRRAVGLVLGDRARCGRSWRNSRRSPRNGSASTPTEVSRDPPTQLPQHVAEARDGADRQAVGLARQRRQRVVGAEDVAPSRRRGRDGRPCSWAGRSLASRASPSGFGPSGACADMVRKRGSRCHSRALPGPQHGALAHKLACPPCNHMIVAVCYGLAMVRSRRCDRPSRDPLLDFPHPKTHLLFNDAPRVVFGHKHVPRLCAGMRATRPLSPSPGRAARTKRESRCGVSPSRPRRLSSRVPPRFQDISIAG